MIKKISFCVLSYCAFLFLFVQKMENNEVESLTDVKLYSNSFIRAIFGSDFPLTHEGPGPAHEVDAAAAGQVHHAHGLEEASLRPQPAGGQTEDECVEHREDDVEIKVGPLRNGAGNDGSSWQWERLSTRYFSSFSQMDLLRRRRIERRMSSMSLPFENQNRPHRQRIFPSQRMDY